MEWTTTQLEMCSVGRNLGYNKQTTTRMMTAMSSEGIDDYQDVVDNSFILLGEGARDKTARCYKEARAKFLTQYLKQYPPEPAPAPAPAPEVDNGPSKEEQLAIALSTLNTIVSGIEREIGADGSEIYSIEMSVDRNIVRAKLSVSVVHS